MEKQLFGRDWGYMVYGLCTPSGRLFYVGRSSSGLHRPRAHFRSKRELGLDDRVHRKIRSMLRKGRAPVIRVLQAFPYSADVSKLLDEYERRWVWLCQQQGIEVCNEWLPDPFVQDPTMVRRGWKHSRKTRRRIGEKHRGRKVSRVTRLLLSKSQQKNKRQVVCLNTGEWHPSLCAAARHHNVNLDRVWGICHKRKHFKTTDGLSFAFV